MPDVGKTKLGLDALVVAVELSTVNAPIGMEKRMITDNIIASGV